MEGKIISGKNLLGRPSAIVLLIACSGVEAQSAGIVNEDSQAAHDFSLQQLVVPTQKYTIAVQSYLLKQSPPAVIVAAPDKEGEGDWIHSKPALPKPKTPQADKLRADMCRDAANLQGRELYSLAEDLESVYQLEAIEEEKYWQDYYQKMTPEDKKAVEAHVEELDDTSVEEIINLTELANRAPQYFESIVVRACSRAPSKERAE